MFCLLSSCWYLSWIWVSNPYRLALFLGCPCCVPLHVGAWWLLPPDRGFHSWTCLCPLVNARFSFCVQVPLIKRRRVRFLPGSKFLLGSCLILISSWMSMDGISDQGGAACEFMSPVEVLVNGNVPSLSSFRFRDQSGF